MSELRSKCCGAKIYYVPEKIPNSYIGAVGVSYAHCVKCGRPTEAEELRRERNEHY